MRRLIGLVVVASLVFTSCVSSAKFKKLEQENNECSKTLAKTKRQLKETESANENLAKSLDVKKKELDDCQNLQSKTQEDNQRLKQNNEELSNQVKLLNERLQQNLKSKSESMQSLNEELFKAKEETAKRDNEIQQLKEQLKSLQNDFKTNENTLAELQNKLKEKQEEMQRLHDKISEALLGFADKGLNVETKNGKVYVSMEEKLLFASGSWTVSKEGEKALDEIAAILAMNPDISIMVEGHTDNIPMKGKNQVKDNWDLSVMRASAIAKILLKNKEIAPERIVPSGRGEYCPIVDNESVETRAKNRRSEIILTPKTDELLKMLE
ncbi:MAG: OmpA family protein [Bacteroidales bacterium]|nr:OmpA family protein [Bacteroidales bacterium]